MNVKEFRYTFEKSMRGFGGDVEVTKDGTRWLTFHHGGKTVLVIERDHIVSIHKEYGGLTLQMTNGAEVGIVGVLIDEFVEWLKVKPE